MNLFKYVKLRGHFTSVNLALITIPTTPDLNPNLEHLSSVLGPNNCH